MCGVLVKHCALITQLLGLSRIYFHWRPIGFQINDLLKSLAEAHYYAFSPFVSVILDLGTTIGITDGWNTQRGQEI